MEWESNRPCHRHAYPGQGLRSPSRHGGWELEFRDYGTIARQGLLLTGDSDRGAVREETVVGNASGGKRGMEARQYCWVICSGWSHQHSLSLPTCQHPELNNSEAGPSNAWHAERQSRTPPRVPHSVPDLSAWADTRATKKNWPKRPSGHLLQEAREKTPMGP